MIQSEQIFDKVIVGAGLYGLYSALYCAKNNESILVIECDSEAFGRATYINQARVHQGYHYPRSLSTAVKSAGYFERFNKDYDFCINSSFNQVYATSSDFSWTDGAQFIDFCKAANIPCEPLHPERFFKNGLCDGAFMTREYTYDARILRDYFLTELEKYPKVRINYLERIETICRDGSEYVISTDKGSYRTRYLLNTSYASTNQIIDMLGFEKFRIKYELCEIILTKANAALDNYGFTVMDGPFFSIMPFGKTGLHSLTAVAFTPHEACHEPLPRFACQERSNGYCSPAALGNCNNCPARPNSALPYMASLARKYMKEEYDFEYVESLYSMKPILINSEIDDSRPTVVRTFSTDPVFVSALSGKINTVYDLDEVLKL